MKLNFYVVKLNFYKVKMNFYTNISRKKSSKITSKCVQIPDGLMIQSKCLKNVTEARFVRQIFPDEDVIVATEAVIGNVK